jgi:inosine-uridine nucleoside N-ribohydrolase
MKVRGRPQPKIVWDMDPGIDDALALLLALKSGVKLLGITAVAGNAEVEKTTRNVHRILEFAKKRIPVGKGLGKPLVRELKTCPEIHGEDGLGNCGLPEPPTSAKHFLEIWRRVPKGSIAVCTGPLTNVAVAFLSLPDLRQKLEGLIVMGGALGLTKWGGGNVTPDAEFNFYTDPEAAHIVLRSGVPLTLVPLDTTQHPSLKITGNLGNPLLPEARLAEKLIGYQLKRLGETHLHDVTALAYLLAPQFFKVRTYSISIDLGGKRGRVIMDQKGARVHVPLLVDGQGVMKLVKDALGFA